MTQVTYLVKAVYNTNSHRHELNAGFQITEEIDFSDPNWKTKIEEMKAKLHQYLGDTQYHSKLMFKIEQARFSYRNLLIWLERARKEYDFWCEFLIAQGLKHKMPEPPPDGIPTLEEIETEKKLLTPAFSDYDDE